MAGAAAGGDAPCRETLVARYEELRRDARAEPGSGPRSHGLALFLRQGMAAWMRAWVECQAVAPGEARSAADGTGPALPRVLGPEVVMVLAEMVLGAELGREGTTG